jgi:hypothetical protein
MKDISQSLTQNALLNSSFRIAGLGATTANAQDRTNLNRKRTLPVHLILEMHESSRLEIPFWIMLALSACMSLALCF